MSIVADLVAEGLVEAVEADSAVARQWLDDARRHLDAAGTIAELDPAGAYVLAYDAARKSVAAALLMTGHRVLSRPGSHVALARYARILVGRAGEPALQRFRPAPPEPESLRIRVEDIRQSRGDGSNQYCTGNTRRLHRSHIAGFPPHQAHLVD